MMSPLAPHLKVKNTFLGFGTLSEDEACLSRNRASSCPPCMTFHPVSSLSPVSSSDKPAANLKDHGDDSHDFKNNLRCETNGEHDAGSDKEHCSSTCTGGALPSSSATSSQEPSSRSNDTPPLMQTLRRSRLSATARPWSSEEQYSQALKLPTSFVENIKMVVRVAKLSLHFVTGEKHVTESKAGSGNWWTVIAHVPSGVALDTKMALATVKEELQHTAAVTKGVSVLSLESLQLDMPTEHGFRVVLCGCGETPQHPPETAVVDVKVAMLSNGI
mmetsp:Transcript_592/g.1096  ORF Transcript_592/g.1096 Transcript_592/m.1096 type:complete len:274 (+) Transcript_592:64-885(+)